MQKQISRFILWLACLGLVAAIAPTALAQFGSSLSGTVEDSTGAAIPNATVTLTNTATQQSQSKTTGGSGFYSFNELGPGNYTIAVVSKGFENSTANNIAVAAETPRSYNVALKPANATESVTVNANDQPALQTADASIGTTITGDDIRRLPTVGDDPYELLRTAPGITGDGARAGNGGAVFLPNAAGPGGSNSGVFQTENQVQISADGQRTADNNFTIDGVSVNSLTHGGAAVVTPNQESVSQLTVLSTSYDAGDGRNSGAQIKVISKSGTNDIHGSLFFQYDEPGLNAFNKYGGPDGQLPLRVQNKQRTYAASFGGPAVKNKLFYFASYEGFGLGNQTFAPQWVETPQFRALIPTVRPGGVSTAILQSPGVTPRIAQILHSDCSPYANNQGMYHPVGGVTQTASGGPYCNPVGNGLDIGSPTPGGASQLGVYVPSFNSATANYVGGGLDGVPDIQYANLLIPSHSRGNQYNARLDYYVTPKDQLAGSVYFTKLDSYGISGANDSRPQGDVPFKPLNSAGTGIYIHTFSPSWVNELRANFTRFAENGIKDAAGTVDFGIPYINVQNLPFSSNVQFGANQASTTPAVFAENTYAVTDTLIHTWGNHTLHLGYSATFEQDNDDLAGSARPVYAMVGFWNFANDAPIYEGISANPGLTPTDPNGGGPPNAQRYFRSEDYAAFIQHDWKATPNLTLNMGLRWEEFTPLANKGMLVNYPVLGSAPGQELTGATLTPHNHLWNFQHKNFGPKVGFAYAPPKFNNKFVVRGGFAVAYNHLDIALFNNALEDGPNIANYGLCCGTSPLDFGTPFAGGTIKYSVGTSNSPNSYPRNPALATGTTNGLPNAFNGQPEQIEVYGTFPKTQNPVSYLYSLDTQTQLPWHLTATVGYAGSLGRHYARLVNQDFIYNTSFGKANTPFSAAYFAQTDSNQAYNSLNTMLTRLFQHGFQATVVYTYSKSLDQVSNGDGADSNANQTDPAQNSTEYGPSDYNATHRVTATMVWDLPKTHASNAFVRTAANGWQINGIATYHTGFPWTPVTYNLHSIPGSGTANVVGPVRPLAYYGGAGNSCSNDAFRTGSNFPNRGAKGTAGGTNYFNTTIPPGNYEGSNPGIGRNSFGGPCYRDVDLSFAKEQQLAALDHTFLLRFQANFFNAFNLLNMLPLTNGNANPSANINNADFGKAQGADAGRVIEFLLRLQF